VKNYFFAFCCFCVYVALSAEASSVYEASNSIQESSVDSEVYESMANLHMDDDALEINCKFGCLLLIVVF
jgi:hypothetical protein